MVIADFNIICFNQTKTELYQSNEISSENWDLNSSKNVSYYKEN